MKHLRSLNLSLFLFSLIGLTATAATKPNVVIIYADDMGYGEIQALNPERSKIPTPSLNKLAEEGMVFTDAHTTSSVCSPSRYGLLTGRYNWRTTLQRGVLTGGDAPLIAADRLTLGKLFQSQGYKTAIFGKWHLNYSYEVPEGAVKPKRGKDFLLAAAPVGTHIPDGPLTRGFDVFHGFHHARTMSSIVEGDTIVREIPVVEVLPEITDAAADFIDDHAAEAKEGKPFFMYFPLSSPHTPIAPAPEWKGKGVVGTYGDFVAQTDGSVGAVMEALERNGLTENTIVIFSADNGTSKAAGIAALEKQGHYPSANLRGSKADLWEGGHRVPFILRWPEQVKASSESGQLISLADMMATFAEMLSVDLADDTAEDSISFYPILAGKELENPRESVVHHSIDGKFAIRQGDWKLLLAAGSGGWTAPGDAEALAKGLPEMQLYDMPNDIGEEKNLVAQNPEKVAGMIKLLETYVAEGRSTPGEPQKNDAEIDIWKKGKSDAPKKGKKKGQKADDGE
ncbi:MAG: arylsulfatase [Akkermansiaceae bacterium]|jgi:arylsulfatase A|nr:arylsulfatase [Akkermansiaceae bacterium]MDP4722083.1 arylsulfatase [Akkermansiaceae bacterium]MDP4781445.1 arylsulfatase [Akkermansiaceae bacterium]MDP4848078.1 arylsulfatase [Akkermansiaceae bacterium]MDP4899095.1 arylsulfatase [Akkermansiaceae bacterium]